MEKKKVIFIFVVLLVFFIAIKFLSSEGMVNMTVQSSGGLYIHSPEVRDYNFSNFSLEENYTIDLNVTSDRELSGWEYTLWDVSDVDSIVREDVSFSNDTTTSVNSSFDAVRDDNRIVVSAYDAGGNEYNDSAEFYVIVNNSAPIIHNLSSEIYGCEEEEFSYLFNVSDVDGDDLEERISPGDPFYVHLYSYINSTYFRYEIYSDPRVLKKKHAGGVNAGYKTYDREVFIDDGEAMANASTNITIIEINNAPEIENIGVHTVQNKTWIEGENNTFYHETQVTDEEDGDETSEELEFSINFSGERLFNISDTGVMNYTADEDSPLGVYTISVCVNDSGIDNPHENISICGQDGGSIESCEEFSLTITDENRAPEIVNYSPVNLSLEVDGRENMYFNVTAEDPDGTIPYTFWKVDEEVIEEDEGSSVDEFIYAFGCGISGNHTITAFVTDDVDNGEGMNDSVTWNVSVKKVSCPPGVEPGGGGGGGGVGLYCEEKWACREWSMCQNLGDSYENREVSFEIKELIEDRCSLFNWSEKRCGYQTRECNDVNKCGTNDSKKDTIRECYYTENPNCSDGIENCHNGSCEILVDCGGPCEPCPTCSDGIKNQGEEGIDCGGPCPKCEEEKPFRISREKLLQVLGYGGFVLIILVIVVLATRYYIKIKRIKKRRR